MTFKALKSKTCRGVLCSLAVLHVWRLDIYIQLFFPLQMKLSVQESTLTRVQTTLRDAEEDVRSLKETVAEQKDELHAGEMERRRLHNTIQELKASS